METKCGRIVFIIIENILILQRKKEPKIIGIKPDIS